MSQEVGFADGAVTVHADGALLRLTLERPAKCNSLSQSMVDWLSEVEDAAEEFHGR